MPALPQVRPATKGPDAAAFAGLLQRMYANFGGDPDELANELGVHRLVWISPFAPHLDQRRQTTFAYVGGYSTVLAEHKVRDYILHPYTLAKNADGRQVEDVYAVLSGERLAELL